MQSLLLVRNVSDMAGVSEEHVSILTSCLLKRVHVIRAMQSKHIHSFRVVQTRQADSHSFLAASSFGAQNSDIGQLQRTWRVSISYLHDCMLCESLWYVNIYVCTCQHSNRPSTPPEMYGNPLKYRELRERMYQGVGPMALMTFWASLLYRRCWDQPPATALDFFGFYLVSQFLHGCIFLHLTLFDIPDQSWSTTSPDNIICRWCEQHLDCI